MSVRVLAQVFCHIIGSATEKAVLICLADHSNRDSDLTWPSVKRIAQETELAESTVRAALSSLRSKQLILQTARASQHRPATYRVNLDALADLQLVEVYRPGYVQPEPDLQEPEASEGSSEAPPLAGGVRPPGASARPLPAGPEPVSTSYEPRREREEPAPSQALRANDQTPWCQALTILKHSLNKSDYKTWVEPTVLVRAENGKVVIGGANEYGVQWLREHVSINVADALEKVLGKKVAVEFVVQPPVREDAD